MSAGTPLPASRPSEVAPRREPYVEFTRRFFRRWSGAYDVFAALIAWVYDAAARRLTETPGTTVLDLCTGTGEVARRCAVRGARVTGVDLTPEMLFRALRKTRGLAVAGCLMDARALGFADRSFDAVCICFALHDMPRPVRLTALAEAARVARERLVIVDYELPAGPWWRSLIVRAIGRFETPYFRAFAMEGAEVLFSAAGLPAPRRRALLPGLFALYEIPLREATR